jgi:4-diphosphocytidyl-2-C-methyl-D-erythritol kinase
MIIFPNAKINLGLHVTGKREDGFHNLETVFYPVSLKDALEIIPAPDKEFRFTSSGLVIPGEPCDNLVVKAFRLLQSRFALPEVHIHLHKAIPTGAGLGGGSSDAAFTLTLLNRLFSLNLDKAGLEELALLLGSDCPFFIRNMPVFATGRGNKFQDISLDLSGYQIRFAFPGVHVSTREAFEGISIRPHEQSPYAICSFPVNEWKGRLVNDFEESVFLTHPEIAEAKEQFYRDGAVYASMTGSGSAVYGIFTSGQA